MRTCIAFLFCLVSLAAFPESNAVSDPEAGVRLPVRRVVLYKSGVGYFEHDGLVRGSQNVTIDCTTAQLNDVLKSLTVLDSGKGRVSGISYNTNAPVDKLLSGLRLPLGQQTTVAEFLSALRGSHVDIRSAAFNASGRLLSVEHRERMEKDQKTGYDVVSLITDTGEVRTFELTPTASIRIGQGEIREEVGRYLRILYHGGKPSRGRPITPLTDDAAALLAIAKPLRCAPSR